MPASLATFKETIEKLIQRFQAHKNRVMAQARERRADSFAVRIEDSVPIAAQGKADFLVGKAIDSSPGD